MTKNMILDVTVKGKAQSVLLHAAMQTLWHFVPKGLAYEAPKEVGACNLSIRYDNEELAFQLYMQNSADPVKDFKISAQELSTHVGGEGVQAFVDAACTGPGYHDELDTPISSETQNGRYRLLKDYIAGKLEVNGITRNDGVEDYAFTQITDDLITILRESIRPTEFFDSILPKFPVSSLR